jgi:hypothetical protein
LEVSALGKRSSTLNLGNGNCFETARGGQNLFIVYSGAKYFLKIKKVLARFQKPNTVIDVLGGTVARCSIRCDGLHFFISNQF